MYYIPTEIVLLSGVFGYYQTMVETTNEYRHTYLKDIIYNLYTNKVQHLVHKVKLLIMPDVCK